ncbi:MAG: cytochrome c3 family protein [Candidatus Rokubacteria bacterium]|nr:cytochrome c3 family protein [Candidatus Rokubacteria bacterium]
MTGRQVSVTVFWVTLGAILLPWLATPVADGNEKFRLKPGAEGKLCLDCHSDFTLKLKSRFVHTPVKTGNCTGCHSPHTSAHGKLLSASTRSICLTCHEDVLPEKARSAHRPVIEGRCGTCHDPHASSYKGNLSKNGNELCVGCHTTVVDTAAKAKFPHLPVSDGCLDCHNPHASTAATRLLRSPLPALCIECHQPDAGFTKQHGGYPVGTANCVSCHAAHGSNTRGILFDTVHAPVAGKACTQCHNPPTAAQPFATTRTGFELCRGCHGKTMNETFGKTRVHWPLLDKTGCLNCHEAHASRKPKLLNVDEAALCGRCHGETTAFQRRLTEKAKQEKPRSKSRVEIGSLTHDPVQRGTCSACHSPHASNSTRLLNQESTVELCGGCHDWLKHESHPMGERYRDKRSKNLSVDCLSCHRSHGTGYRYLIAFPTPTELCVQCHKQQKR